MKIGLLVYGLDRPLTGIGRYILELARYLASLPDELELFLLVAGDPGPLGGMENVRYIPLPGCRRLPGLLTLGSVQIPAIVQHYGLDLVHDPTGSAPFLFGAARARLVVTIHDVFVWSCPGNSSLLDTVIYRYWLPLLLSSAKQEIITDSNQSRRDIEQYLSVTARHLQVIPCGIGSQFRLLPSDLVRENLRLRFGISWPYVLYVGALTQRKNIARSLQAFAQITPSFPNLRFVIVGPRSWKGSTVESLVVGLDLRDRVFLTGPVPDSVLPVLYNGAELFVFPSLYEGFGLPPLEAMACGAPVVTSNVSSLPDVVGEAALLVDPLDVDAIASAMRCLMLDPHLASKMRQKGLARAAGFTWERTARLTLSVYQNVLNCV